ncbi:MAG TPA: phage tail tube protein [Flavisolibacter sp.]|nr:phage tail tube protein [Flavisolibacter sp.]
MANVKGKLVVFRLSTDGGTTKKILVCLVSHRFSGSTEITTEQTMCDGGTTQTAIGARSWTMNAEGYVKKDPTVTEVSYQDLLSWWNTDTELWAEMTDPDDTFLHQGNVVITSIELENTVNDSARFSLTFTGNGALTIA